MVVLGASLVLSPKVALVGSSWAAGYLAMRRLPISLAAPVRATAPLWTLLGAIAHGADRPGGLGEDLGVGFAVNEAFLKGGEGAVELAQKVVDTIEKIQPLPIHFTYPENDTIEGKIEKVCKRIYGAAAMEFTKTGKKRLEAIREIFGDDKDIARYPICIAKTQFSFSADSTRYGSPEGFTIRIRDVILNCGSEMIVAIAGDMLRMPGLPKSPQAERITIVNGEIEGLS